MIESPTPVPESLLRMLRCPVSHSPLQVVSAGMLDRVNRAIDAGLIQNQVQQQLSCQLDSGLINADDSYLIPVYGGIPCLRQEELIALDQLDTESNDV